MAKTDDDALVSAMQRLADEQKQAEPLSRFDRDNAPAPTVPEPVPNASEDYFARHRGYVPPAPPEPIAGIQPIQQAGNLPGNPFVGWRADPFNQFLAGAYNTVAPVFAPQVYTPLGQQYNQAAPVNVPAPYQPPQGAPRPVALPPDERTPIPYQPPQPSGGMPALPPDERPPLTYPGAPTPTPAPSPTYPTEPGVPQPPSQKERDFQSKIIRLMQEETLAPTLESAGLRGKGFMFYVMDEGSRIGKIPTVDQMNQFSPDELRAMVQDANQKGYFTPDRINQRDAAFRAQMERFEQQRREQEPRPGAPYRPPTPGLPLPQRNPPSSLYGYGYNR